MGFQKRETPVKFLDDEVLVDLVEVTKDFYNKMALDTVETGYMFGFRDEKENRKYFCCIVYEENEMWNLNVYNGNDGLFHCLDSANAYGVDAYLQQDCISVSRMEWDRLNDAEYDQYVRLGFDSPKNECFIFHRQIPGYVEIQINEREVEILKEAYRCSLHFMRWMKKDPSGIAQIYGETLQRFPVFTYKRKKWDMKVECLTDYPVFVEVVAIANLLSEELLALPLRGTWEIGLYCIPKTRPSLFPHRHYFPQILIMYDVENKIRLGTITKDEDATVVMVVEKFFELILKMGYMPKTIIFRNPQTAGAFEDMKQEFGCTTKTNFFEKSVLDDIWKEYEDATAKEPTLKN